MLTRTGRKNENQNELATEKQIIVLHGLLRESEALARRINYPLTSALFSIVISSFFKSIDFLFLLLTHHKNAEEFLLNILFDSEENLPPHKWPLFLIVAGTAFYSFYKIFQWVASKSASIFPNGLTFRRNRHPAYAMQEKLGSKSEVRALIVDLKQLVSQQRTSTNRMLLASIVTSMAMLFAMTPDRFFRIRVKLRADLFGPHLIFTPTDQDGRIRDLSTISSIAQNMAHDIQRFPISKRIRDLWSNWNTPKQIRKYAEHLDRLISQEFSWQVVPGTEDSKMTAVFSLDIPSNRSITLPGSETLPPDSFIHDLSRMFIAAKIPVFVSGSRICVGYHDLNPSYCRRNKMLVKMQRIFNESTHRNALHERYAETNVTGLNKLNALLKIKGHPIHEWDFYRNLNERDEIETYYYTSISHLPRHFRAEYIRALGSFVPAENIVVKGDILIISKVPLNEISFDKVEKQLRQGIEKLQAYSLPSHLSAPVTSTGIKRRKPIPMEETVDEKKGKSESKEAFSPYPSSILFSHGIRFLQGETKHSPERAYPLHVPWLPEGCAYVSIDARVVQQASPFAPPDQVIARLDRGVVIGASKTNKTKAGTVGLQATDEPFKTIDGIDVPCAFAKVKVDNMRFFARKFETITVRNGNGNSHSYLHYRIDGMKHGH